MVRSQGTACMDELFGIWSRDIPKYFETDGMEPFWGFRGRVSAIVCHLGQLAALREVRNT
jgi:hypothetical protein